MSKKVLVEQKGGVLSLVLNNPAKLNCMGFEMLSQLNDAVCEAKETEEIKLVLIKGAGERAFSTGADLKEFKSLKPEEEVRWIELGNSVFNRIESLNKATVAYIDGYAMGGGLELALACDFRVASSRAVLSSPELQHGWLPGWGGLTRMKRLFGEAVAKEVIFLCEKIDAEKALRLGILNLLVENETSHQFTGMIKHLASLDSSVFALAKAAIADENRTTKGVDLKFDILAMQLARQTED
ncbi:MAG: enoyl-CoA hydratase/isomerase family protein [Bacteroides sp.]|nr:enoyl-CoA hydratase/isomerase family protein [Bacteroides sp.]